MSDSNGCLVFIFWLFSFVLNHWLLFDCKSLYKFRYYYYVSCLFSFFCRSKILIWYLVLFISLINSCVWFFLNVCFIEKNCFGLSLVNSFSLHFIIFYFTSNVDKGIVDCYPKYLYIFLFDFSTALPFFVVFFTVIFVTIPKI